MTEPSDTPDQHELRDKIIGLGERSLRKSHYAALQRSLRELAERDRLIRAAYSDVIAAITGGRLVILDREELESTLISGGVWHELRDASQLREARSQITLELGDVPAADNLVLAFSEAATNTLKHAGGGTYRVARSGDDVQIILSDTGPGIDFRHLPRATLTAGWSGAQSLGMGFTLMLELSDRLLLHTDSRGTTLVIEKDVTTADKSGALDLQQLLV